MAFAAFFARFALFATALFARTVVGETITSSRANSLHDVQSGCIWECNVVGSEFGLEMKALISEYRLITLHLKYEQQVDKKCSNQTDAKNSSIKLAELWTWLTGENPSHGGQNMSQPSSSNKDPGTWFRKSLEGQIEVGVLCSLQPTKDLNARQPSLNDLIAMELMEEVAHFASELSYSDTVLCYKLSGSAKNGSFVCVNKTHNIAAGNIYLSWQENGFRILEVLSNIVAIMYFPAILCLLTPTEVKTKKTGRVNIVLNGTSPVGIRSWIANSISSHADSIRWKLLQTLLFLFICMLGIMIEWEVLDLVLPPSLAVLENRRHLKTHFILLSVFSGLLTIRAFMRICWTDLSLQRPCLICDFFGDRKDIRHDQWNNNNGREEITMHLRLQPSVVVRCCRCSWNSFVSCLYHVFECFHGLWPPLTVILRLLSICLIPVLAIVACLFKITVILFHSCPLSTLYDMLIYGTRDNLTNPENKKFVVVGYLQLTFIVWAAFYFIEMVNNLVTIIKGILMQLPDYLPYASLVVVIAYYVWKCYSTFLTRKYDNLALKLYKLYKTKLDDSTRVIPKDLFDEACEKLIPVRESVGMLVMTIIPILAGIFFLYFAVIMKTPGANDITQAIGTLLTTLIPPIAEMMFGKDQEMRELDDTVFNERVGTVVDEYFARPNANNNNNGGTSTENEGENEQTDLTPLLP